MSAPASGQITDGRGGAAKHVDRLDGLGTAPSAKSPTAEDGLGAAPPAKSLTALGGGWLGLWQRTACAQLDAWTGGRGRDCGRRRRRAEGLGRGGKEPAAPPPPLPGAQVRHRGEVERDEQSSTRGEERISHDVELLPSTFAGFAFCLPSD